MLAKRLENKASNHSNFEVPTACGLILSMIFVFILKRPIKDAPNQPGSCDRVELKSQNPVSSSLIDKKVSLEPLIFAQSEKFGAFTAISEDSGEILFIGTDAGYLLMVAKDTSGNFNLISARFLPSLSIGCDLGNNKEIKEIKMSGSDILVAFQKCLVKLPRTDCQTDQNCFKESCEK